MKQNRMAARCGRRAALAAGYLACAVAAPGAISFADIRLWAGSAAGPGVSEAAMVIDWRDGSPGLVWGYRWPSAEPRTGRDMLEAVLGADPALAVDSTIFPNAIAWAGRTRSYDDRGTASFLDDRYWGYWVNNEVFQHPTDFMQNGHVVPPATVVVPLGNPFGSGRWVESSTGAAQRPLVNGSWDGWAFGEYGTQPLEPVAVPEPGAGALVLLAGAAAASRRRRAAVSALALTSGAVGATGPFPPGPGQPGSDAVAAASPAIRAWATGVAAYLPGPQRRGSIATPVNYGTGSSALGPTGVTGSDADYPPAGTPGAATAPVVSLGDGGSLTLTFARPIADGPGADFAVFENGFATGANSVHAELAFVEVSSNGVDFVRFPAVSCTATAVQVGTYGTIDPRNVRNLAGKHPAGWGTPFDLAELSGSSPVLDIGRVTHVRLVDVVGSLTTTLGSRDAQGNLINDPFPTPFQTGGFDADAVGVMNEAADPWESWREAVFTAAQRSDPAVSGSGADPDGDGWTNFMEYAAGGAALTREASSPLRIAPAAGGALALEFFRDPARRDVRWRLESCAGGPWQALAEGEGGGMVAAAAGAVPAPLAVTETGGGPVTVRVTVPRDGDCRMFRLRAERMP